MIYELPNEELYRCGYLGELETVGGIVSINC